ncbi:MAG: AraC family transcriptional regulator ligand-binding domain-containing protein, partial [Burkholderiales bacterium]
RQNLSVMGPLWLTARSARTVGEALDVLVQFFIVHTNGALLGLERTSDGGAFVTYSLIAGISPRDRQTIELGMALMCQEMRVHCGAAWQPRALQFCHDPPKRLLRNKSGRRRIQVAAAAGLTLKPRAAARRMRAAMLRWRCCSS